MTHRPPSTRWWLSRGPFEMLDPILRDPDQAETLERWAGLLNSGASLSELALKAGLGQGEIPGLTEADIEHFTTHWLGEWFGNASVEPVLRQGLALGWSKAVERGVPADILLVSGVPDFQVAIAEGPGQVTIIVGTPTVDAEAAPAGGAPGTVTIVAHVEGPLSEKEAGGSVNILEQDGKGQIVAVQLASSQGRATR
ncbi:MAG: hypothetical protein QOC92_2881 [Acidimicrobiaceae bacterium]